MYSKKTKLKDELVPTARKTPTLPLKKVVKIRTASTNFGLRLKIEKVKKIHHPALFYTTKIIIMKKKWIKFGLTYLRRISSVLEKYTSFKVQLQKHCPISENEMPFWIKKKVVKQYCQNDQKILILVFHPNTNSCAHLFESDMGIWGKKSLQYFCMLCKN